MNFDFDLTLPERGDCHCEFSASFDYGSEKWEADDSLTVWLADDEAAEYEDLDQTSKLILQEKVEEILAAATPSEADIREAQRAEIGDRQQQEELDNSF